MNESKGLSLIELMIAISLSIFLAGVAVELLLQTRQSYKFIDSQNKQLDTARIAFSTLKEHVAKAGFIAQLHAWEQQQQYEESIYIEQAPFAAGAAVVVDDRPNRSDQLWLRYQASQQHRFRDCFNRYLQGPSTEVYTLRFFIDEQQRLMCQRIGFGANEVVAGLSDMQIKLGVQFIEAGNVKQLLVAATDIGEDQDYRWSQVVFIRIALLTRADVELKIDIDQEFKIFETDKIFEDGIKRVVITQDLYLKNGLI